MYTYEWSPTNQLHKSMLKPWRVGDDQDCMIRRFESEDEAREFCLKYNTKYLKDKIAAGKRFGFDGEVRLDGQF